MYAQRSVPMFSVKYGNVRLWITAMTHGTSVLTSLVLLILLPLPIFQRPIPSHPGQEPRDPTRAHTQRDPHRIYPVSVRGPPPLNGAREKRGGGGGPDGAHRGGAELREPVDRAERVHLRVRVCVFEGCVGKARGERDVGERGEVEEDAACAL